ncbi:MAG: hypothetical protein H7338_10820 [Candidatus Sericytochromatia bacterium]|nr:hypothetical protein [Candidatus Sericytochromatia bacterium]
MLELTRKFLAEIPNLGALMDQVVIETGVNVNNFEELRVAREEARDTVMNRLREFQGLHHIIQFPELIEADPVTGKPVKGGYIELNNISTGKSVLIPMFVWTQFIEHDNMEFTETIVNLGNSRVSDRPMPLDFSAVFNVMKGATIPADVIQEIQASAPQIQAVMQRVQAARG